jgi:hypothetical protein
MTARDWIEIILAGTIPFAILCLMANQWRSGKALGVRLIQLVTACTFMPTIIILAMERILDVAAVAALVGGVIGYLFSNIREPGSKTKIGDTPGTTSEA